jgi:hypothetical protein
MSQEPKVQPQEPFIEPKYNRTFELLVSQIETSTEKGLEEMLIGFLAYGFYKNDKRRHTKAFYKKYKRLLNDEDKERIMDFFDDIQLDRYRSDAETKLYKFAYSYLEKERETIETEAIEKKVVRDVGDISKDVTKQIKEKITWRPSVIASLCATFFWTLIIILGLAGASLLRPDSDAAKIAKAFFTDTKITIQYVAPQAD